MCANHGPRVVYRSIQDEDMMPPQVAAALEQVRQSADVMPRHQLETTMREELGENWEKLVAEFDWEPSAAASIGQVHRARLHDGRQVAMKVQYPGTNIRLCLFLVVRD